MRKWQGKPRLAPSNKPQCFESSASVSPELTIGTKLWALLGESNPKNDVSINGAGLAQKVAAGGPT